MEPTQSINYRPKTGQTKGWNEIRQTGSAITTALSLDLRGLEFRLMVFREWDEHRVRQATRNYREWLVLNAWYPRISLLPLERDVWVAWETHLSMKGQYRADCEALFGTNLLIASHECSWVPGQDIREIPKTLVDDARFTWYCYAIGLGKFIHPESTRWLPNAIQEAVSEAYASCCPDLTIGL